MYRLRETFGGYWREFWSTILFVLPLFVLASCAAVILQDHSTARVVVAGVWHGSVQAIVPALAFALCINVPVTVARNARVAVSPVWLGPALALYLSFGQADFLGDVNDPWSWIYLGLINGAVVGTLAGVAARLPPEILATAIAEILDEGSWWKRAKKLFSGSLGSALPWGTGGAIIGAFSGPFWGMGAYLTCHLFAECAHDFYSCAVQATTLGSFVGFAASAILTPGNSFFGRWDLVRILREAKVEDVDGQDWKVRSEKKGRYEYLSFPVPMERIRKIDLHGTDVRSRDMIVFRCVSTVVYGHNLTDLKNLVELSLHGCRRVGDNWISVEFLAKMERLDLSRTRSTGWWLGWPASKLRELRLGGCNLGKNAESIEPNSYPMLEYLSLPKRSLEKVKPKFHHTLIAND